MNIQKIHLEHEGLAKFFGTIEYDILTYLWKNGSMTITEFVRYREKQKHPLHANTITTITKRMVTKGLLQIEQGIQAKRYSPTFSKNVMTQKIKKQLETILHELKK